MRLLTTTTTTKRIIERSQLSHQTWNLISMNSNRYARIHFPCIIQTRVYTIAILRTIYSVHSQSCGCNTYLNSIYFFSILIFPTKDQDCIDSSTNENDNEIGEENFVRNEDSDGKSGNDSDDVDGPFQGIKKYCI